MIVVSAECPRLRFQLQIHRFLLPYLARCIQLRVSACKAGFIHGGNGGRLHRSGALKLHAAWWSDKDGRVVYKGKTGGLASVIGLGGEGEVGI